MKEMFENGQEINEEIFSRKKIFTQTADLL